jgi:hypothetical protein
MAELKKTAVSRWGLIPILSKNINFNSCTNYFSYFYSLPVAKTRRSIFALHSFMATNHKLMWANFKLLQSSTSICTGQSILAQIKIPAQASNNSPAQLELIQDHQALTWNKTTSRPWNPKRSPKSQKLQSPQNQDRFYSLSSASPSFLGFIPRKPPILLLLRRHRHNGLH